MMSSERPTAGMEDVTELTAGADHLRLVLAVGEIGVWDLDVTTGKAWRSLRATLRLGL